VSDTRSQIGEVLDTLLSPEQLALLADKILEIDKTARGWCPKCNHAVNVTIPDAKSVTGALAELLNQSKGRPRDDKTEVAGITLVRRSLTPAP
jgi:hypothetical protein